MCGAESCNEVIFECADCSFSCIATMDAWGHNLAINFFSLHEFFENCRAFVVESVKLGFEASSAEDIAAGLEGFKNLLSFTTLEWSGHYGVRVIIIQDKDIFVSLGRCGGKFACLV